MNYNTLDWISNEKVRLLQKFLLFFYFNCIFDVDQNTNDIKLLPNDSLFNTLSQGNCWILIIGDAVCIRDFFKQWISAEKNLILWHFVVFRVIVILFTNASLRNFINSVFSEMILEFLSCIPEKGSRYFHSGSVHKFEIENFSLLSSFFAYEFAVF